MNVIVIAENPLWRDDLRVGKLFLIWRIWRRIRLGYWILGRDISKLCHGFEGVGV